MKVWLDFANSPHPLLFARVARLLEARGHSVVVTVRDNAQTLELTRARWPEAEEIGGPSPGGRGMKALAIGRRVADLRRFARRERPDVALSHNSYAQIAAAASLRLPVVTGMDYEHQPANHLAFRLADRILLPEALPVAVVRKQGATARKVIPYPGLKELLSIGDFEFDAGAAERLGAAPGAGEVLVVLRAPPAKAIYHRLENPAYARALEQVGCQPGVRAVVLARDRDQRDEIAALGLPNVVVPEVAVDARSLLYAADLVVGAGGTMTREAALLGVPTVSIFAGRPPLVDVWLERQGRLRRLAPGDDLGPIGPREREPVSLAGLRAAADAVAEAFASAVETVSVRRASG